MPAYPGELPETLAEAYAIQMEAARIWGTPVIGWKIGRIVGEAEQRWGKNRFIGPIFADTLSKIEPGECGQFPVIPGGSSALEAEVVAVLGRDIAPERTDWSPDEAAELISSFHIAIEVAGCPVPSVNALGPLASIAVFGNNIGLILGPKIAGDRTLDLNSITCRTTIDGVVVGDKTAGDLPGGPAAAIAFALNQAAELSIPLTEGTLLSTGAITGVHDVTAGQFCEVNFGPLGQLRCKTAAAQPF